MENFRKYTIKNRGCTSSSFGNQIHHIIQVRENGGDDVSNLILLCPNHHKQADFGILTIEELRKKQVKESEMEELIEKGKLEFDRIRIKSMNAITKLL